jgi:hypothetical protein
MKKLSGVLLALMLIFGCGKFEEGPKISFVSVKNRIAGEWKLEKFMQDEVDITEAYLGGLTVEYTFEKDFTLEYRELGNQPIKGTWEVDGTNLLLELEMTSPSGLEYFEQDTLPLIRLTNSEMWARFENGDEKHFTAK